MMPIGRRDRNGNRLLATGLGLVALTLAFASFATRPPRALPVDAPAQVFSAGRALAVLSALLGEGQAHPIGSESNREVRGRIWRELEELGYQPQLQREAVCGESGRVCGVVENVLARLEGSRPGKAVMLSCHYDSVPAGPGAADDGSGVAALLEIARILKQGPQSVNPILFFFGDGEEVGLLGAEAFVQNHPWASEVGAVVNVEARGTSGRSWMFETSRGSSWLLDAYSGAVSHPATSSIAYAIYQRLPNDTDLTVYKRFGLQGLGLAFIGDVQRYHTPLDDVPHLSPDTLQQQGETALEVARALSSLDLAEPERREAVFFDLAGLTTVWWPQAFSTYFSLVAVLLLIVAFARLGVQGRTKGREFLWGFFAWPFMIGLTALAAVALGWVLDGLNVFPSPFPARSWPSLTAFRLLGFSCPLIVAAAVSRRSGFWGLWSGTLFWWTSLALATTLLEPALGYPLLPPVLAAGAGALLVKKEPGAVRDAVGTLLPVLVGSLIILPTVSAFHAAFGRPLLPLIAVLIGLTATWLAPLSAAAGSKARWGIPVVGLAAAAFLALVSLNGPAYTSELPQRLSIRHGTNADTAQSMWHFLGQKPLPAAIEEAGEEEIQLAQLYPWSSAEAPALQAPESGLQGPLFESVEVATGSGDRIFEATLRSARGAPYLELVLPAGAQLETVKYPASGEISVEQGDVRGDWGTTRLFAVPSEGIRVRFRVKVTESDNAYLLDGSPGLPASGAPLKKARGSAVPFGQGDATFVYRKVSLQAND